MKFNVHNGSKFETIYTPDELQRIVETSASYYADQVKELQSELSKTKEELREEVREEFKDEIQRLKDQLRFSIATLETEKELKDYKDFVNKHNECKNKSKFSGERLPIIIRVGTALGICTEIQCPICGEKKDITDIGVW